MKDLDDIIPLHLLSAHQYSALMNGYNSGLHLYNNISLTFIKGKCQIKISVNQIFYMVSHNAIAMLLTSAEVSQNHLG